MWCLLLTTTTRAQDHASIRTSADAIRYLQKQVDDETRKREACEAREKEKERTKRAILEPTVVSEEVDISVTMDWWVAGLIGLGVATAATVSTLCATGEIC